MRPLSINEEAYEDAATKWAEAANDPAAFPSLSEWLAEADEARMENLLP